MYYTIEDCARSGASEDCRNASIYQQLFIEIQETYCAYIPVYTYGSQDGNYVVCADSISCHQALQSMKLEHPCSNGGVPYNDFKHCLSQYIFIGTVQSRITSSSEADRSCEIGSPPTDGAGYILRNDPPPQCEHCQCILSGARSSSVVRAFAHGAMGRRIDPSWGGPIELFLVLASAPRLV